MGHEADAHKVMIGVRRRNSRHEHKRAYDALDGSCRAAFASIDADFSRLGNTILHWTVGYGHAPIRSLYVMFSLWLVAFLLAQAAWNEGRFAPDSGPIIASALEAAAVTGIIRRE